MSRPGSTDDPDRPEDSGGALEPRRLPGQFVFVGVDPGELDRLEGTEILASVVEPEGMSLVLTQETADAHDLDYDFVAAWITLGVQSSLDAVGLTASVSSGLFRAGIACNVIAGFRHDHLLVPVDRAEEALALLGALRWNPAAEYPDPDRLT